MTLTYKQFKQAAWQLPAGTDQYYQHGLNNGKTEAQLMTYNPEGAKRNFKESFDPFRNATIGLSNGVADVSKMGERLVLNNMAPVAGGIAQRLTDPAVMAYSWMSGKSPSRVREYVDRKISNPVADGANDVANFFRKPMRAIQRADNWVTKKLDRPRDHEDTPQAHMSQAFRYGGNLVAPVAAGGVALKTMAAAGAALPTIAKSFVAPKQWFVDKINNGLNMAGQYISDRPWLDVIWKKTAPYAKRGWDFLRSPLGKALWYGHHLIKYGPTVATVGAGALGRYHAMTEDTQNWLRERRMGNPHGGAGATVSWGPEQQEQPWDDYNNGAYIKYGPQGPQ